MKWSSQVTPMPNRTVLKCYESQWLNRMQHLNPDEGVRRACKLETQPQTLTPQHQNTTTPELRPFPRELDNHV